MSEHKDAEHLRVSQAAARLGVTVRTLRYWESIGLAHANTRSPAGYRLYDAADMERLHRISVYRELGVDLEAIRKILDDPGTGTATLERQHEELVTRIERLRTLDRAMTRMIAAHEHGILLNEDEQARAFGPEWDPTWPERARRRYGGTTQWHQYAERSASRDASDWKAIADAMHDFERSLGKAMDDHITPGSPVANILAERHRELLSAYYPLTRSMQVCLARMYAADPEYHAHYDGIHTGLAAWLARVIEADARAHGIDPNTATWQ